MLYSNSEELAENKLILLLIMSEMKTPATKSEITQIVLENGLMNYFAMQQLLSELIEGCFVTCYEDNQKHYYRMEKRGAEILQMFESRIPEAMKQQIKNYLADNEEKIKKEKQIIGRYTMESHNEYTVSLKIVEYGRTAFDLELKVSSHKLARKICENWNNNAPALFGNIVNILINPDSLNQ